MPGTTERLAPGGLHRSPRSGGFELARSSATVVLRRLPHLVLTLLLVTAAVSLMVAAMPGDPAAFAAGDTADPAFIEVLREELGLNQGVVERYVSFLGGIARGDLGTSVSISRGVDVGSMLWDSLAVTASLMAVAFVIAVVVALPAGYLAAVHRGRWIDRIVTAMASLLLAIPPFVLGVIAVTVLALDRAWLPALGYKPLADGLWPWLSHLLIPALALGAVSAAEMARQVRGAFVDTLEKDYIRTATAKGMLRRTVVWKHALKNAASPMVIVAGLQIPRNIGAAVVVERLFALPGFGLLAFHSVERRDVPVMQGVVLAGAVMVLLANVLTDVGVTALNPKLRHDD